MGQPRIEREGTSSASITRLIVLLVTLLFAASAVSLSPTPTIEFAAAAGPNRTCGVTPGEGAYYYYRVRNVSCRIARRVSRKAHRNFCGHSYKRCQIDSYPQADYDQVYKGSVRAKGWRCRMRIAWEFYRAKCKRGNQRFKHETAA